MDKMLIKPYIQAKLLGLCAKVFRLFHITYVYQGRTGLKELNPCVSNGQYQVIEYKEIPYDQLFLGIDFLNDNNTLIDTPIATSPHFELMRTLSEGNDYMKTEYVERMLRGALDERYVIVSYCLNKSYFRSCYEKHIAEYEEGIDREIVVYQLNGKYYLHDGKHRAAMCALIKKSVRCKVITPESAYNDFNLQKIHKLLSDNKYQKHIKFFER